MIQTQVQIHMWEPDTELNKVLGLPPGEDVLWLKMGVCQLDQPWTNPKVNCGPSPGIVMILF